MASPEFESQGYHLPVVSFETAAAAVEDFMEHGEGEHLVGAMNNMRANNPNLLASVLGFAERNSENEEEMATILMGAGLVHEILRKQAAAEKLDESLGPQS
jgi:hypothetical protein